MNISSSTNSNNIINNNDNHWNKIKKNLPRVVRISRPYPIGTIIKGKFSNGFLYPGTIISPGYNPISQTYHIIFEDGDNFPNFRSADVIQDMECPLSGDKVKLRATDTEKEITCIFVDRNRDGSTTIYDSTTENVIVLKTKEEMKRFMRIKPDNEVAGINILSDDDLSLTSSYSNKYKIIVKNIVKGNIIQEHNNHPAPKGLKIQLKLHQQRMLHEMIQKEKIAYRLSNKINMFVLSDKVGSGKSIDILALLCEYPRLDDKKYLSINKLNNKMAKLYNYIKGFEMKPTIIFKTNLIVIPHNIFNQWNTYITEYTDLSVYYINARKKIHNINLSEIEKGKYNIILVKSTMYNDFMKYIYSKYPLDMSNITTERRDYKDIYKIKDLSSQLEYD